MTSGGRPLAIMGQRVFLIEDLTPCIHAGIYHLIGSGLHSVGLWCRPYREQLFTHLIFTQVGN